MHKQFIKRWIILELYDKGFTSPIQDDGIYGKYPIFNTAGYISEEKAWEALEEKLLDEDSYLLSTYTVVPIGYTKFIYD